jgi:hypothetical protein
VENPGRLSAAAVAECQRDMPRAVSSLHFGERPVQHLGAPGDDGHPVAHLLGLLHVVGGEHHGSPRAGDLDDHVFHYLTVDRIQSAERLVEDDELRLVQQGPDELDFLLHAFGQVLYLLQGPVLEPQPLQPLVGLGDRRSPVDPLGFSQERQLVDQLHLLVQTALLGEKPDSGGIVAAGPFSLEENDFAFVRDQDVHDHAERGCLTGTVGAKQSVDAAPGHLE